MQLISLDLETTGLHIKSPDRILQLSMIYLDTDCLPSLASDLHHLTVFVDPRLSGHEICGEPYALQMNAWILKELCSKEPEHKVIGPLWINSAVKEFLETYFDLDKEKPILVGKNVGSFDYQFLPEETQKLFHHRMLDIGNLFIDFSKDKTPPDLKECKVRAGINSPVAHDAYGDALDVARCIYYYVGKQK